MGSIALLYFSIKMWATHTIRTILGEYVGGRENREKGLEYMESG